MLPPELVPGIGVDIEPVARWRAGGLRLSALFTEAELAHGESLHDPARHLAGLWCAKEAVFKALAPWIDQERAPRIGLREISISHDRHGAPVATLAQPWDGTIRVSISYTPELAMAVALAAPGSGVTAAR